MAYCQALLFLPEILKEGLNVFAQRPGGLPAGGSAECCSGIQTREGTPARTELCWTIASKVSS